MGKGFRNQARCGSQAPVRVFWLKKQFSQYAVFARNNGYGVVDSLIKPTLDYFQTALFYWVSLIDQNVVTEYSCKLTVISCFDN